MSWFGNLELGLKFSIVLGALVVLTICAALIKVAIVKKRETKQLADLEAAKCETKEDQHNLVKRELDEGDLFGVRAIEAGYTGGVAQPGTRSVSPVMNSLRPGLGHMKNASRSGTPMGSRRGSLDVPRLGQHSNGSLASLKLPTMPLPAHSRNGSREQSPAPLRIESTTIAAPFKGLEWNGSRPTTPRGSHVPVPILTFTHSNNNSQTDLSQFRQNNSSFGARPSSPVSRPDSDMSNSSDESSFPRVAKFQAFQHSRVDSSASSNFSSSNFGTPISSRSRSPNTSIDSTPKGPYAQYNGNRDSNTGILKAAAYNNNKLEKGRPVLRSAHNDSGIQLSSQ